MKTQITLEQAKVILKTKGYYVPDCAESQFLAQVNCQTKKLILSDKIWFINRAVRSYDSYNGSMIYDALMNYSKTRSLLPDSKVKGAGLYASQLANTFTGNILSEVLRDVQQQVYLLNDNDRAAADGLQKDEFIQLSKVE